MHFFHPKVIIYICPTESEYVDMMEPFQFFSIVYISTLIPIHILHLIFSMSSTAIKFQLCIHSRENQRIYGLLLYIFEKISNQFRSSTK